MSNIDLWMRDVLASYGIIGLIILCVVIWIIQKWPTLRKDTYKAHLLGFEMECAELASPYKEHLFKALQDIISNDEMLRSMGSIRILEIGVKTGENIQFYPEGTHLIGVDWNVKLGEYLIKGNRSWQFSHVIIERLITGDGSSLKEVLTGSVDVVVTTRSLCSVKSVHSTLQEIRRVLAPGGKYIFVEHIPEKEGTFIRWLQLALTRTGIWPSLFGDCRLDVNCVADIENAGFKKVSWTFLALEGYISYSLHLILSRQHVCGIATR
ncbi:PREDICTED: methyltransferase-like protein 7A isoform X1 [Wasmannia auropunctata]|uniref:methyltransferase-like protein 7A isoform X1 n=2 Tax=Wasmannia auropunctata TaxID=64793 RepID=UPI0005EF0FF6|nr:PREDICTED: methyltransferase-like protein 7A isoform X1 [Wasmannia auropunctata]XP_011691057.1 PREDICTED: methyltransferase-like protein 7A isoform X1 [Wasmannia auropunctata]